MGLYGLAFHAAAAALELWTAKRNQADVSAGFWWTVVPAVLVAAFVVYALVVAPYVPRRPAHKMVVFYDCVVAMLGEVAILALTSVLYGLLVSRGALSDGVGAYLLAAASTTSLAFLFVLASFFTRVLVWGNAAGFLGWFVMKKVNARRAGSRA